MPRDCLPGGSPRSHGVLLPHCPAQPCLCLASRIHFPLTQWKLLPMPSGPSGGVGDDGAAAVFGQDLEAVTLRLGYGPGSQPRRWALCAEVELGGDARWIHSASALSLQSSPRCSACGGRRTRSLLTECPDRVQRDGPPSIQSSASEPAPLLTCTSPSPPSQARSF